MRPWFLIAFAFISLPFSAENYFLRLRKFTGRSSISTARSAEIFFFFYYYWRCIARVKRTYPRPQRNPRKKCLACCKREVSNARMSSRVYELMQRAAVKKFAIFFSLSPMESTIEALLTFEPCLEIASCITRIVGRAASPRDGLGINCIEIDRPMPRARDYTTNARATGESELRTLLRMPMA